MWVWRDKQEKWLLAGAISAFVLVCLVNAKLPLWPILEGTTTATFLRADATASVTSDLLIGLISAYMFYLVIDLLPRHRKEQRTLRVLNLLVASVADAFHQARIFGHETSISSIDVEVLDPGLLDWMANEAKKPNPEVLRLKYAMETAHSRYPDFQHSLSLASAISADHALEWLVLTDKVRLLAEVYGTMPHNPFSYMMDGRPSKEQMDDLLVVSSYSQFLEKRDVYESTMQFRVVEAMEAAAQWSRFAKGVSQHG